MIEQCKLPLISQMRRRLFSRAASVSNRALRGENTPASNALTCVRGLGSSILMTWIYSIRYSVVHSKICETSHLHCRERQQPRFYCALGTMSGASGYVQPTMPVM